MVAGIQVRRESSLPSSSVATRVASRPRAWPVPIDDPPAALDLARLDGVGLHVMRSPACLGWFAPPSRATRFLFGFLGTSIHSALRAWGLRAARREALEPRTVSTRSTASGADAARDPPGSGGPCCAPCAAGRRLPSRESRGGPRAVRRSARQDAGPSVRAHPHPMAAKSRSPSMRRSRPPWRARRGVRRSRHSEAVKRMPNSVHSDPIAVNAPVHFSPRVEARPRGSKGTERTGRAAARRSPSSAAATRCSCVAECRDLAGGMHPGRRPARRTRGFASPISLLSAFSSSP